MRDDATLPPIDHFPDLASQPFVDRSFPGATEPAYARDGSDSLNEHGVYVWCLQAQGRGNFAAPREPTTFQDFSGNFEKERQLLSRRDSAVGRKGQKVFSRDAACVPCEGVCATNAIVAATSLFDWRRFFTTCRAKATGSSFRNANLRSSRTDGDANKRRLENVRENAK
jgi:hypothetical protein